MDFTSTPPVVSDGPYAEAREVFTGFWILEVADREEAELWARKCPLGPGVALEVRLVAELADMDLPADNEWLVKEQEWRARQHVTSRIHAHRRIPAAVRAGVSEKAPDGARERRIFEGDLPQHAVVPSGIRPRAAVLGDVLGAKGQDDQFVDRREVFHEVPWILTPAHRAR